MSDFKWSKKSNIAAVVLAEGFTQQEAADKADVTRRTVERWMSDISFRAEVDRLSQMIGVASRAERLRIAMRVVRQRVREGEDIDTDKDLLDWLKFAQSETDGIKLDLAALADV